MIREILALLNETESQNDLVKLAKGKNKYPESFKELIRREKNKTKWKK